MNIPDRVKSLSLMSEPNQSLLIHKGEFILVYGDDQIVMNGEINYNWFPIANARFSGIASFENNDRNEEVIKLKLFQKGIKFNLMIDNLLFSQCRFTSISIGSQTVLEGISESISVRGDRSIIVNEVLFSVANMRDFHGSPIKGTDTGEHTVSFGRIEFDTPDFTILLDKSFNHDTILKLLQSKGGYAILYNGSLIPKKNGITFNEASDLFHCFSNFLSLINGRRCSAIFKHGIYENQVIWSDFTNYNVDSYKRVTSWPVQISTDHLNSSLQNFYKIWKSESDRKFLKLVIHWYVEANSLSAHVEGSIILAQTALELIYNWLIIEKKAILAGKDAETISASNKIRLLISQLHTNHEVPLSFKHLQGFVESNKEVNDAPEAFVQIRNAIVHSQKSKRDKLAQISSKAQYEALQLSLWYIELSMLYILNFKGNYYNRCSGAEWLGEGEEMVPWMVFNEYSL
ncbi:hypothetical protein MON38_09305 [Hymenobacter sp. DH14]|uniref:YopA central domain-containing protein n=1 Tax=Hymenobacter cyanobacteriorum TaxID=2926463 RepID=A0A9X1VJP9_9BACT|nr:hypothetical protein [Hymenobacter cyanobacteriorum]MCI1187616.1 hypothetical protein [Hymenobacter cyanobacteriorum]